MARTVFTTITPIPAGVSRETVLSTLHDHLEMVDLNPTHDSREPIKPPPEASPEEYHCKWYQITDKISYLPGVKGEVRFKACFHDLPMGLQTHVYAPMGLDIKEKWTLGGNLPHEPVLPVEIGLGAPISGLYLREDVEMKCNFLMAKFVKKQLKEALASLVARLVVKSQLVEADQKNRRFTYDPSNPVQFEAPLSPPMSPQPPYSPLPSGGMQSQMEYPQSPPMGVQMDYPQKWAEAHSQQQAGQRNSYIPQQYSPQPQYSSLQPPARYNSMHQPQHSPQYPPQQGQSHPLMVQQQMQQQQQQQQQVQHQGQHQTNQRGSQGQNKPDQPLVNEMDGSQAYTGQHHGYYGPAELA